MTQLGTSRFALAPRFLEGSKSTHLVTVVESGIVFFSVFNPLSLQLF